MKILHKRTPAERWTESTNGDTKGPTGKSTEKKHLRVTPERLTEGTTKSAKRLKTSLRDPLELANLR